VRKLLGRGRPSPAEFFFYRETGAELSFAIGVRRPRRILKKISGKLLYLVVNSSL